MNRILLFTFLIILTIVEVSSGRNRQQQVGPRGRNLQGNRNPGSIKRKLPIDKGQLNNLKRQEGPHPQGRKNPGPLERKQPKENGQGPNMRHGQGPNQQRPKKPDSVVRKSLDNKGLRKSLELKKQHSNKDDAMSSVDDKIIPPRRINLDSTRRNEETNHASRRIIKNPGNKRKEGSVSFNRQKERKTGGLEMDKKNVKTIKPIKTQGEPVRKFEGRKEAGSRKKMDFKKTDKKIVKTDNKRKKIEGSRKSVINNEKRANLQGRATVNDTCLDTSMKMLKIAKDKVTNFLAQYKRMRSFNKTAGKKQGKKGLFAPVANRLIDVGGGNISAISCGGDTKSAGAAAVNTILATLQACETSVSAACDPESYPHPENATQLEACFSTANSFKTSINACLKKSGQEACDCFEADDLKTLADTMKGCDVSSENKLVTAAHNQCKSNFSTCKSTEDSAGSYLYSCAQTASALKEKAGHAAANLDAFTLAKNKTDDLTSNSTSRHRVARSARQGDLASCTAVAQAVATLISMASQAMYNPIWRPLAMLIAAYAGPGCTVEEKATLVTQSSGMTIVIVQITSVVVSFKGSVEVNTGVAPTDEEIAQFITTAAPTPITTPAPGDGSEEGSGPDNEGENETTDGPDNEGDDEATGGPDNGNGEEGTDMPDGGEEETTPGAPDGTMDPDMTPPDMFSDEGMVTGEEAVSVGGDYTDEGEFPEEVTDDEGVSPDVSPDTPMPIGTEFIPTGGFSDMTEPSVDYSGMPDITFTPDGFADYSETGPTFPVDTFDPSMPTDSFTDETPDPQDMTMTLDSSILSEEMSSMPMDGTMMSEEIVSMDGTMMSGEMTDMTMEGTLMSETMSTMSMDTMASDMMSSPETMTMSSPGYITTGVPSGSRRKRRHVLEDIRAKL